MEKDLSSRISPALGLDIQAIGSSTTTVGNIIDSKGFESLDLAMVSQTLADGDYVLKVEHGDDSGLSDAADAAATDLIGSLPVFADTEDDAVKHVGYVGKKRYVRPSIVSTNVSSGGTLGVLATLGHAKSAPTQ